MPIGTTLNTRCGKKNRVPTVCGGSRVTLSFVGRSEPDAETLRELGPLWAELHGGLWHTTHPERFLGVIEKQAILVEPALPDSSRWGTRHGRRNYPYARFIGGLSLFDFSRFDPFEYAEHCPLSNWRTFVPFLRNWGAAVWIEVDRSKVDADAFVSGLALRNRWHGGGDLAHNLMPYIEAAHIGDLPLSACSRGLFVHVGAKTYEQFSLDPFDKNSYARWIRAWKRASVRHLEHLARGGDGTLSDSVQRQAARQKLAAMRRGRHFDRT